MLKELAAEWGFKIHCHDDVDGAKLLIAIAQVESSGGTNAIPRHEQAYSIGGYYYRNAKHVRVLFKEWGDWAACSYSSWQIMFITATELGYTGTPIDLRKDHIAIPYVVKYLNVRAFDKESFKKDPRSSLDKAADAYNSGSYADKNIPEDYIAKVKAAYIGVTA